MSHVPGLRSPYAKVGRLVFFGRMLDKIRLHAAGKLPADYVPNCGDAIPGMFDARCCRFLGVRHAGIAAQVIAGKSDAEILAWCHEHGGARTDEQCETWNMFLMKRGWRDESTPRLKKRVEECGLTGQPVETWFDLQDYDEGRDPARTRPWEFRPALALVLMGVAGSGKTTIGRELAATLGWRFDDADDFHPPANVAKMSAGIPLEDTDRAPWLRAVGEHLRTCLANHENVVAGCSALKRSYRHDLLALAPAAKFVYLKGSREVLLQRIGGRQGHFMKPEMLDSQLAALEEPDDALAINIAQTPEEIVAEIRHTFGV